MLNLLEKRPLLGNKIGCASCGAAPDNPCSDNSVTHAARRRMYALLLSLEAGWQFIAFWTVFNWVYVLLLLDMQGWVDFSQFEFATNLLVYGGPVAVVLFWASFGVLELNEHLARKERRRLGHELKCHFCKRWQLVVLPRGLPEPFARFVEHRDNRLLSQGSWWLFGKPCPGSRKCVECYGSKLFRWEVPGRPNNELITVCPECSPEHPIEGDSVLATLHDLHATFQSLPHKEANTPEFGLNLMAQQILDAREHLKEGRLDKVADEFADMLGIAWQAIAWQGQDPEATFIRRTRVRVIPHALELAERDRAGNGYKPPTEKNEA